VTARCWPPRRCRSRTCRRGAGRGGVREGIQPRRIANVTLTRAQKCTTGFARALRGSDLSQNCYSRRRRHQHRRPQPQPRFRDGEVRLQQAKQMVKRRMTWPRRSATLGAGPISANAEDLRDPGDYAARTSFTWTRAHRTLCCWRRRSSSSTGRRVRLDVQLSQWNRVMSQILLRSRFCTTRRGGGHRNTAVLSGSAARLLALGSVLAVNVAGCRNPHVAEQRQVLAPSAQVTLIPFGGKRLGRRF